MSRKIQIVIADDNDLIRQTLKDILTERGYFVDTVKDGYELLSFLEAKSLGHYYFRPDDAGKGGIEVFDSLKYVCPG